MALQCVRIEREHRRWPSHWDERFEVGKVGFHYVRHQKVRVTSISMLKTFRRLLPVASMGVKVCWGDRCKERRCEQWSAVLLSTDTIESEIWRCPAGKNQICRIVSAYVEDS